MFVEKEFTLKYDLIIWSISPLTQFLTIEIFFFFFLPKANIGQMHSLFKKKSPKQKTNLLVGYLRLSLRKHVVGR